MSTTATERAQETPDASRAAPSSLIRRVRRLWQETPGVRLVDLAEWIGNRMHPSTLRQHLWGEKPSRPLTIAECETIIARIQAIRAARQGRG